MAAGAVPAVLRRTTGAVVVVQERRHVGVDAQDHRAARAAVAAVGATQRLELLAVDRGHAVAAPSRGDVQRHPVDERRDGHGGAPYKRMKGDPGRGRPSARPVDYWLTGRMLITRRPRRVPNSTLPATSANSVSSPPRPTPVPGWKWVPRWRTMISPALTSWPP